MASTLKPTSSQGGSGSGTISDITSTDMTITVTNPTGPTTDLSSAAAGGTVTSVSSANNSIAVATGTTTPVLTVGTVDKLFTNNAPAGNLGMNTHKLTGLAAGSTAGDSVRYEQAVKSGDTAGGDLSGTYPNPSVAGITESGGPTDLTIGTITDGQFLKRSGTTVVSAAGNAGTVTTVSSANNSITVANASTTPALTVGTVDKLFTNNAPAASMACNSQKFTGLAAGSGNGDSVRYEQVILSGASAGGDLGSTYPNPTVTSGAHLGAATVPIAALADPTTGKVIGSASNAAAAVFPPGYEINYTPITGSVNVVSTTESSGTTIISPGAITFDGSPVLVHFFCPYVLTPQATSVNDDVVISLFEGATQIGRLTVVLLGNLTSGQQLRVPVSAFYRFTPTAASHTYTVTAFTNSTTGSPAVVAGAGGTGTELPAFLRFTKV